MKGLKLLTSLLAVGAVSTIFAAASFATDFTANAEYTAGADGAAATVAITGLDSYTADNAVGDYTVVILNADVENPTNENIVYVMQGTKAEISTAKFANLTTDGIYYVRVGGSSQGIAKATFVVGSNPDDKPYPNSTRVMGDVNGADGLTDINDSTLVSYHITGMADYALTGEDLAAADVNDTGDVDINDYTLISYNVADPTTYPFSITNVKDKLKEVH